MLFKEFIYNIITSLHKWYIFFYYKVLKYIPNEFHLFAPIPNMSETYTSICSDKYKFLVTNDTVKSIFFSRFFFNHAYNTRTLLWVRLIVTTNNSLLLHFTAIYYVFLVLLKCGLDLNIYTIFFFSYNNN